MDWGELGTPWQSGFCYQNKGECNLDQSNVDSFVKHVAKNNRENNGGPHKTHKIFQMKCFVFCHNFSLEQSAQSINM